MVFDFGYWCWMLDIGVGYIIYWFTLQTGEEEEARLSARGKQPDQGWEEGEMAKAFADYPSISFFTMLTNRNTNSNKYSLNSQKKPSFMIHQIWWFSISHGFLRELKHFNNKKSTYCQICMSVHLGIVFIRLGTGARPSHTLQWDHQLANGWGEF